MKKILAGMILCLSLVLFTNSTHAESNPLLTIFEGIKVSPKTLFSEVEGAIRGFGEYGSGLEGRTMNYDDPDFIVVSWGWSERAYSVEAAGKVQKPRAILSITIRKFTPTDRLYVIKAVYEYKFLDTEEKLVKE